MKDEIEEEIVVQAEIKVHGHITKTMSTDIPHLQRLVKENYEWGNFMLKRLIKARKQRDEARAEVMRLQGELDIWKKIRGG